MQEAIEHFLKRIEQKHDFRIIYACESGSRAWGFESPDSDYDIRFLFVRGRSSYLSVAEEKDAYDIPMEGDLDAGGWDVKKAAGLLGKSNGALLEWLHSPIIYRADENFLSRWRTTANKVFSPHLLSAHYHGLTKQMVQGKLSGETARAKDYLYALRASLAALWIRRGNGIPPVPFADLLDISPDEVRDIIPDLLTWKSRTTEAERMKKIPVLDSFLTSFLEEKFDFLPEKISLDERHQRINSLFRQEISSTVVETSASYTLERVRRKDVILLDSVAGSHAYGLAIHSSDEDRRGVFVASPSLLGGLENIEQVADEKNDQVYYEIGKWFALLLKNNPTAMELLAMPEDCIRARHPIFDKIKSEIFLSKLCEQTFGNYAFAQIRKARSLNKKIFHPQPEERRTMLSFCHVPEGQGSIPVMDWLQVRGLRQKDCGITAVRGAAGLFAIYTEENLRGIVSPKDPDVLVCSSVPKEAQPIGWMHYNEDAFASHCKAHREYWEWVTQRNEDRYTTNIEHGRGYDSKNLMHTIRLLEMAEEIAREGIVRVRRPNREYLLDVRAGKFSYDELIEKAESLQLGLADAYAKSSLPKMPDRNVVNQLLIEIRTELHG